MKHHKTKKTHHKRRHHSSSGGSFKPMDAVKPALFAAGAYIGLLYLTRTITKTNGMANSGFTGLLPAVAGIVAAPMLLKHDKTSAVAVVGACSVLAYNVASTAGLIGKDPSNPIMASLAGDEPVIDVTPAMAADLVRQAAVMHGESKMIVSGPSNANPFGGPMVVSGPSNSDPWA